MIVLLTFAVCLSRISLISADKGGVYSLLTISNGHSANGYSDEFMPQCLRPTFLIWAACGLCELSNKRQSNMAASAFTLLLKS